MQRKTGNSLVGSNNLQAPEEEKKLNLEFAHQNSQSE